MPTKSYYEQRKANHTITVDEQACKTCERTLPASEFYNDYFSRTGLLRQCKECSSLRSRAYRYGISAERIRARFKASQERCEICAEPLTLRSLTMDHDRACCPTNSRTCGQCFRGIVCRDCNVTLGRVKDDVSILESMAEYLSRVAA